MKYPIGIMKPEEVIDHETMYAFVHQKLGVPYPTTNDKKICGKMLRKLFEDYPNASFGTIVRICEWSKARRKRHPRLQNLISDYRYAWTDGYLPELDPEEYVDEQLQDTIDKLMLDLDDEYWRARFLRASTSEGKAMVYKEYMEHTDGDND